MADNQTPDIELLLAQHDWIHGLARRLVRDPHDAADLTQESMLRALAHPPRVAGDAHRLRGWLVRVAQDLAYKARRSESRRAARELRAARAALNEQAQGSGDESAELVVRADLHQRLVAAVLELPEPSRSAVLWRYFEGLSVAEIAKREELEPAAVSKRIARGIERLRGILDARHGGDREAWCQLLLPLVAIRAKSGMTLASLGQWAVAVTVVLGLSLVAARGLDSPEGAESVPDTELPTAALVVPNPSAMPPTVRLVGLEAPKTAQDTREPVAVSQPPSDQADGEALLRVSIVSENAGEPVAGVRAILSPAGGNDIFGVIVDRSTGKPYESLRTDAEGVLEFTVPTGTEWVLSINGRAVKYSKLTLEVAGLKESEQRELPIRLALGERLPYHVQLVDTETGLPIEGAEFRGPPTQPGSRTISRGPKDHWDDAGPWQPDGEILGRSDHAGHVELTWLSWKPGSARIFARGYSPASVSLTGTRADPASPKVIKLPKTARVFGHLWDDAGNGVEGLTVGLLAYRSGFDNTDEAHRGGGTYLWSVKTGADGSFELTGLPALTYLYWEIRDGKQRLHNPLDPLRLEPGEARDLSQPLVARHTVRGLLLTPDGNPVGMTLVQLAPARMSSIGSYLSRYGRGSREAQTDAEGQFVFEDVPRGKWFVGPAPARGRKVAPWAPYGVRITVPGGTPTVIAHSHFIEGSVRTDTGTPLRRADVRATHTEGSMSTSVLTDSNGNFRVGPLAPGEHGLLVMPVTQGSLTGWILPEWQTALEGATGVELTLVRSGAIVGRPVDASTGQVVDAKLYVACLTPGSNSGFSTGEYNGSFSFGNLRPGPYVVVATTEDARIGFLSPLEVEANVTREGIEIEVTPGARLELVAGNQQRRCWILSGGVRVDQVWVEPRTTEVVVVPAGVVRVVPYTPDGEIPGEGWEVTLEVGETVKLSLE